MIYITKNEGFMTLNSRLQSHSASFLSFSGNKITFLCEKANKKVIKLFMIALLL